MWRDICLANRERCAASSPPTATSSSGSTRCSRAATATRVLALFERARAARERWLARPATATMRLSATRRPAMEFLDLAPVARMAGTVRLPGSKSISNRTLLLAALARGTTSCSGLLDADDVDRMLEALRTLGVRIERARRQRDFAVHGTAGAFPVRQRDALPRATPARRFAR